MEMYLFNIRIHPHPTPHPASLHAGAAADGAGGEGEHGVGWDGVGGSLMGIFSNWIYDIACALMCMNMYIVGHCWSSYMYIYTPIHNCIQVFFIILLILISLSLLFATLLVIILAGRCMAAEQEIVYI